ncbi:Co2+/Mg2+ efflux protein ApaG [Taklimakanibacter deserti]|jgi:ApaG protein|uniref:Co2+/Mg2+ efflux protein ApaG n=1 Tax=Taklimakanibacter deserti TaxID=2267839 RepID=UPI000E659D9E
MYESVTRNIRVVVRPKYLQSQSRPEDDHFVWAYTIAIANLGTEIVTLRSRHWRITDDRGKLQEVRGEGVVGEQPTLAPGKSFEYTSAVPLSTPSGFMVGTYQMETSSGERFDVDIPAFSLDSPQSHRLIN